jgi:hypothetical protein
MRWNRLFVVALLATPAYGCDPQLSAGVSVDNRTASELHFRVQLEPGRDLYVPPATVGPHAIDLVLPAPVMPRGGCAAGAMVAFDEDDREVARRDQPVCIGDTWVIDSLARPTP